MAASFETLKDTFPRLVGGLSAEAGAALARALTHRHLAEGEVLVQWGDETDTMHLVESGLLSVYIKEGERKLILGQAGAGMIVGEIGMILPGPASATVSAMSDSAVLSLTHEGFEKLCTDSPEAASALLTSISRNLVKRMRNAAAGLRRIDERTWMKQEATTQGDTWRHRLAILLIGKETGR